MHRQAQMNNYFTKLAADSDQHLQSATESAINDLKKKYLDMPCQLIGDKYVTTSDTRHLSHA